jgi:hypothetical protein
MLYTHNSQQNPNKPLNVHGVDITTTPYTKQWVLRLQKGIDKPMIFPRNRIPNYRSRSRTIIYDC